MDWSHPRLLWLILPLSFAWLALALIARSRRRRALAAFVAAGMQPRILPADSSARFWVKALLWEIGLVCSIVALAGPRFGVYYEYVKPRGADLYVSIDVSRSMLATDVLPSRLGRAKADVSDLLEHLNGERVALLAFAGKAVVQCPLTTDYGYFRDILNGLDPTSAPRGGTAIGDAVRKALQVLPDDPSRDQAILLITDGDDHESYPERAAEHAAERRVAIFAIGLGDDQQGALVPKGKEDGGFLEYKGKQVRSKLDNELLEKIAVLTGGVYVPAGTRQYNLGELYENHLKRLRAEDAKEEKRQRLSEQYQLFLALALFAFLLELLISPHPRPVSEAVAQLKSGSAEPASPMRRRSRKILASSLLFAVMLGAMQINAAESKKEAEEKDSSEQDAETEKEDELPPYEGSARSAVREGLASFKDAKYDLARQRFAQAEAILKKNEHNKLDAAIAAFNLACAWHRKDVPDKAESAYLTAGMARNKDLSADAHYNLGCLSAEEARSLAGEDPLKLEPDKRTEVVEKLKEAARHFRRCLDEKKDHADARRNLELVRQWVKYHADKWRQLDRDKRRKESPLLAYLDYLIATEKGLHEEVRQYKRTTPFNALMEAKRLQTELHEDLDYFRDRLTDELTPKKQPANPLQKEPKLTPEEKKKEAAEELHQRQALRLLTDWVDKAGQHMKSASENLGARNPEPAAKAQKAAATELERVWEALVPFFPLLKRELVDQSIIAGALAPEEPEKQDDAEEPDKDESEKKETPPKEEPKYPEFDDEQLASMAELQETVGRRAMILGLKADQELKQLEQAPVPQPQPQPGQPTPPGQPDPEKLKEGFRKAIELAPKAAEKMAAAAKALREKQPVKAHPDAEEAKKILEEIEEAFKQDQQQQDQQKQNQENQKDEQQKQDEDQKKEQQKKQQQKKQEMSRDRMEAMLRKVREREKLKEKYDKKVKAYLMGPGNKVEKDW